MKPAEYSSYRLLVYEDNVCSTFYSAPQLDIFGDNPRPYQTRISFYKVYACMEWTLLGLWWIGVPPNSTNVDYEHDQYLKYGHYQ